MLIRTRAILAIATFAVAASFSPAFAGRTYIDASWCRTDINSVTGATRNDANAGAANDPGYTSYNFDAAADNSIACPFVYPAGAATSGTPFTAIIFWEPSNTNTGTADFEVKMATIESGDPAEDMTFGTAVTNQTSAGPGTAKLAVYKTTSAFAPAAGDLVADRFSWIVLTRDADDGVNDTFTGTANVRGIWVTW